MAPHRIMRSMRDGTRRVVPALTFHLPGPRILANSVPKAGTHLLSHLLSLLPRTQDAHIHVAIGEFVRPDGAVDERGIAGRLRSLHNGQYATAHLPAEPAVVRAIETQRPAVLLMFRDPRDIAVSYLHYVGGRPQHELHRRFVEEYPDDDARLMALIRGFEANERGPALPSMASRLDAYAAWLGRDYVLPCRFEALVGPRGGGDADLQRRSVAEIAAFIERPLADDAVRRVAEQVFNPGTHTFRRGVIGDWRNHFTAAHRREFDRLVGDRLQRLGYDEGP